MLTPVSLLRSRSARPVIAVCAAGLAAAAVTGCGPVEAGAAAVVGSDSISVDKVQQITNRVLAIPEAQSTFGDDKAELQREVLSRLIGSEVLAQAADKLGVTVTDGAIDDRLQSLEQQAGSYDALVNSAAQSGISRGEIRSAVRDLALTDALATKLVADLPVSHRRLAAAYRQNIDHYDTVHVAHILVKSKKQAQSILRQVRRNPDSFASIAKSQSLDTQSGATGGDLGENGINQFVPSFGRAAFKAEPGSFILVHSKYGWHVIHVISHTTTSLAEATPELRASILSDPANTRLTALFASTVDSEHIVVSPRYGKWDASQRAVVASPDDLSRPAILPTPVQTSQPLGPGTAPVPTAPPGG